MHGLQRVRNRAGSVAAAVALALAGGAVAAETDLEAEVRALRERVQTLEASQAGAPAAEAPWTERITFSGLVEIEAFYADAPGGNESDITLSTVELGLDAQLTDWVGAHVLVLFEEADGDDTFEIDEASVTIGNPEVSPLFLSAGRMYVPFGRFETQLVSDPLTLEIGETRETAVQVGFAGDRLYGSVFAFNGDVERGSSDHLQDFGAEFGVAQEAEDGGFGYDFGISYVRNLADSDSLQDTVTDPDALQRRVAGIGVHGLVQTGPFTFIAEYLAALDRFDVADLAFNGNGAKPYAWNLEAGYGFEVLGKAATAAVAWQETRQALALELPERRILVGVSVEMNDHLALALEWARDKDYGVAAGARETTPTP